MVSVFTASSLVVVGESAHENPGEAVAEGADPRVRVVVTARSDDDSDDTVVVDRRIVASSFVVRGEEVLGEEVLIADDVVLVVLLDSALVCEGVVEVGFEGSDTRFEAARLFRGGGLDGVVDGEFEGLGQRHGFGRDFVGQGDDLADARPQSVVSPLGLGALAVERRGRALRFVQGEPQLSGLAASQLQRGLGGLSSRPPLPHLDRQTRHLVDELQFPRLRRRLQRPDVRLQRTQRRFHLGPRGAQQLDPFVLTHRCAPPIFVGSHFRRAVAFG
mmetsp:Transcript_20815/g.64324  ORF Transcript_20815/g.64324 Transcript_20815/m.64324 type:complete len:274 (+) Transcript_20815:779-1600(+)